MAQCFNSHIFTEGKMCRVKELLVGIVGVFSMTLLCYLRSLLTIGIVFKLNSPASKVRTWKHGNNSPSLFKIHILHRCPRVLCLSPEIIISRNWRLHASLIGLDMWEIDGDGTRSDWYLCSDFCTRDLTETLLAKHWPKSTLVSMWTWSNWPCQVWVYLFNRTQNETMAGRRV